MIWELELDEWFRPSLFVSLRFGNILKRFGHTSPNPFGHTNQNTKVRIRSDIQVRIHSALHRTFWYPWTMKEESFLLSATSEAIGEFEHFPCSIHNDRSFSNSDTNCSGLEGPYFHSLRKRWFLSKQTQNCISSFVPKLNHFSSFAQEVTRFSSSSNSTLAFKKNNWFF